MFVENSVGKGYVQKIVCSKDANVLCLGTVKQVEKRDSIKKLLKKRLVIMSLVV